MEEKDTAHTDNGPKPVNDETIPPAAGDDDLIGRFAEQFVDGWTVGAEVADTIRPSAEMVIDVAIGLAKQIHDAIKIHAEQNNAMILARGKVIAELVELKVPETMIYELVFGADEDESEKNLTDRFSEILPSLIGFIFKHFGERPEPTVDCRCDDAPAEDENAVD